MDVLSEIIETSLGIHLGVYAHRVAKTVRSYLCGLNDTEFGLIFGGYCFTHSKTQARSVHSLNFSTCEWSARRPMPTDRVQAACVSLDRFVYVIGGLNASEGALASVDIFDPLKDCWISCHSRLHVARHSFGAAAHKGKLYVFGGCDDKFRTLASIEVFDPCDGKGWRVIPQQLDPPRAGCRAVSRGKQGVLVIGGHTGNATDQTLAQVDVFDPLKRTLSKGPPLVTPRSDFGAGLVGGAVMVVGGDNNWSYVSSCERLASDAKAWHRARSCAHERTSFATFSRKTKLYAVGGYAARQEDSIEVFHPDTETWKRHPKLPCCLHGHCGAVFSYVNVT